MKRIALLLSVVIVAACSGKTILSSSPSAHGVDAGDDGGPDSGHSHLTTTPSMHRPSGPNCAPSPVGPEPEIPDAGPTFACAKNEDCAAHAGGRCVYEPGACGEPCSPQPPGSACVYDECSVDTDCPAASACSCGAGGPAANTCGVAGNCRIDSDCASGFCSPSADYCGTFNGNYCHTASDECNDDSDCGGDSFDKCIFNSTTQAWTCSNVGCAAAGAGP